MENTKKTAPGKMSALYASANDFLGIALFIGGVGYAIYHWHKSLFALTLQFEQFVTTKTIGIMALLLLYQIASTCERIESKLSQSHGAECWCTKCKDYSGEGPVK